MILSCPTCATKFTIDPKVLGAKGRTVRCARCKHQWHASAPLITLPGGDVFSAIPPAAAEKKANEKKIKRPATAAKGGTFLAPVAALYRDKPKRHAIIAAVVLVLLMVSPIFFTRLSALGAAARAGEAIKKVVVMDGAPSTRLYQEDGRNILKIEGALINNDSVRRKVPHIKAQGLNARGNVVKEWDVLIKTEEMEPGQRLPFSFTTPFSEQGVVDIGFQFM